MRSPGWIRPRPLQKATIATNDFLAAVAGVAQETFAHINDRIIGLIWIGQEKATVEQSCCNGFGQAGRQQIRHVRAASFSDRER